MINTYFTYITRRAKECIKCLIIATKYSLATTCKVLYLCYAVNKTSGIGSKNVDELVAKGLEICKCNVITELEMKCVIIQM